MALNPPPRKVYDFPELAIDDIDEFAKSQRYAVATFRSKTDKQTLPTVWAWARACSQRQFVDIKQR